VKGSSLAALRTRAILMLFAVYGLRSSEVSRLLLSDFDWGQEAFVVNHSTRRRLSALSAPPRSRRCHPALPSGSSPEMCLPAPVRHPTSSISPVGPSALWWVTSSRLKATGLRFRHTGPHSLRHACATRLLQKGASFKEIGDVLGHRSLESVGVYAKVDLNALSVVANANLGGLL
jgi:integrase/recombinase XerD